MKSLKKITYNHRFAQSKESWETKFLSKINDANDLLYLAAVKSNNYTPLPQNNTYYTEENKPKILSNLDEIVKNPYNQRFHKVFNDFLEEAKRKLDSLIAKNSKPSVGSDSASAKPGPTSSSTGNSSVPGRLTVEKSSGESRFKSTVTSYDGDEIRQLIEQAKTIAKTDPKRLKTEWMPILDKINSHWPFIEPSEVTELNQDIESLHIKYNEQFYPQGGKLVNGRFFPYTIDELILNVEDSIDKKEVGKANDAIERIKIIYNQNRRFKPDTDKLDKLNAKIRSFNLRNTDNKINEVQ